MPDCAACPPLHGDGDQVLDGDDNCPADFNPGQEDSDLDETGGPAWRESV